MSKSYKYLFGPVPSRRFGLSLGVDLVPRKTCTLDCVFCEVGPTTCLTAERKEYAPLRQIEKELALWRSAGGRADVVSVTGAGEPTLHSGFGEILEFIKKEIKIKSVLLTNSTLMHLPGVRRSACAADIVKVTFSAWDEDSFRLLTRPHPGVRFADLLDGLRVFRSEYAGELWMEVFIVPGINDGPGQIRQIAALARSICPDKIQLNTAVRPTAESGIKAAPESLLNEARDLFQPKAEVIARYAAAATAKAVIDEGAVLSMLRRRPCTARDVAASFALDPEATLKALQTMQAQGTLRMEKRGKEEYYMV